MIGFEDSGVKQIMNNTNDGELNEESLSQTENGEWRSRTMHSENREEDRTAGEQDGRRQYRMQRAISKMLQNEWKDQTRTEWDGTESFWNEYMSVLITREHTILRSACFETVDTLNFNAF